MGAPLHCYTCVGGGEFLESWGVGESKWSCGVMVEATNSFRLHPRSISHVYKMFWQLDVLWMEIWVHPYTVIMVQVGLHIWKVAMWVRPNGVVVSWFRLQTASEGIPHLYHMYTKCFSILICCGWTCGCTVSL
jgi:hypothetical protein